jgi:cysteinyl-tRNA synthetase
VEWSEDRVADSARALARLRRLRHDAAGAEPGALPPELTAFRARFESAMDDDFNTPEALAVMHGWRDHELLRRAFGIFGLDSVAEVEEAPPEIAELAARRREARDAKDFAGADRLRDEIAAAGWEVRDVAEPPGYRLVPRS